MKFSLKNTLALITLFFFVSAGTMYAGNETSKDKNTETTSTCSIKVMFEYAVESLEVAFTDVSKGKYDQLVWNFGDGKTSSENNPKHEYTKEGLYEFCLTVENSETSCSEQFCGQLQVFK